MAKKARRKQSFCRVTWLREGATAWYPHPVLAYPRAANPLARHRDPFSLISGRLRGTILATHCGIGVSICRWRGRRSIDIRRQGIGRWVRVIGGPIIVGGDIARCDEDSWAIPAIISSVVAVPPTIEAPASAAKPSSSPPRITELRQGQHESQQKDQNDHNTFFHLLFSLDCRTRGIPYSKGGTSKRIA